MTLHDRFWSKVSRDVAWGEGCWLFTGAKDKFGQGRISVEGKPRLAHRVAYELQKGPIPPGRRLRHTCGTVGCVNPSHLVLGVASKTKPKHGYRGEGHFRAKLTGDLVRKIRRDPRPYRTIAKELGLHHITVSNAARGLTWRHVTATPAEKRPGGSEGKAPGASLAPVRKRDVAKKRSTTNMRRGSGSHLSKLTEDLVVQIRAGTRSAEEWAGYLGVSLHTILRAKTGKTWTHVGGAGGAPCEQAVDGG